MPAKRITHPLEQSRNLSIVTAASIKSGQRCGLGFTTSSALGKVLDREKQVVPRLSANISSFLTASFYSCEVSLFMNPRKRIQTVRLTKTGGSLVMIAPERPTFSVNFTRKVLLITTFSMNSRKQIKPSALLRKRLRIYPQAGEPERPIGYLAQRNLSKSLKWRPQTKSFDCIRRIVFSVFTPNRCLWQHKQVAI